VFIIFQNSLNHNIERCKTWVSPNTLVRLAAVLNVEPYELFKADALLSSKEKDILQQYADKNIKAVLSVANQLREPETKK
jgi:transcriptional regulator with XRE-family HTH domain